MLICKEGIEGKMLSVRILLTNKRVEFKVGKENHPSLTKEEEDWILKSANIPEGWIIEREKEDKPKKPKEVKQND